MAQNKYGDDFALGQQFVTPRITVTETHVVNWAGLTMDFYPLHMDCVYAEASDFGQRLAHGPMIFGLAVGLVAQSGFGGDAAIAWLGVDDMRMTQPVFIGDTVHVELEIKEKIATRDPRKGIQIWRYRVCNQHGKSVLEFDYKMMFHMRGEAHS